ncbi:MAG: DNA-binding protein, partial [Flavobacteriaceae bacterium]
MEQNSLKPIKSVKFDVSDYLDSEEMISAYINEVIKEGSAEDIKNAIGHIAKAIG